MYKLKRTGSKYIEKLEFIYMLDMRAHSYYPLKAVSLMNDKPNLSLKALFIIASIGI